VVVEKVVHGSNIDYYADMNAAMRTTGCLRANLCCLLSRLMRGHFWWSSAPRLSAEALKSHMADNIDLCDIGTEVYGMMAEIFQFGGSMMNVEHDSLNGK
jgi:hypothetical protein